MKKILSAVLCAVILFSFTACGNMKETAMPKPEIKIGGTTVTLPCTIKDIKGVAIDEETITEYTNVDELIVHINYKGDSIAYVNVENSDKDVPVEEKNITSIWTQSEQVEFYGIQCWRSTFEDVSDIFGKPSIKEDGHRTVPLGNNYFVEFYGHDGKVQEIELYKYFPDRTCIECE